MLADIHVDILVEIELLLLTFCTGIQDGISFFDFRCFASNQTGNSVVLAVGLAGLDGGLFVFDNVAMSLGMFVAGGLVTGQIAHLVGPRKRSWLLFTHAAQSIMIFSAAAVQFIHGVQQAGPWVLVTIALLAFSSGAQVASMRPMQIPEISTVMATGAWVDLVADPYLLNLHNRSRNRRVLFLVALMAGSFAGAFMQRDIGSALALVVSGVGKLLVTVLLLLNRAHPAEETVLDYSGLEYSDLEYLPVDEPISPVQL